MKKRILSFLLIAAMVLCLLPAVSLPAFAAVTGHNHLGSDQHIEHEFTSDITSMTGNSGYVTYYCMTGDITLTQNISVNSANGSVYVCTGGHKLTLGAYDFVETGAGNGFNLVDECSGTAGSHLTGTVTAYLIWEDLGNIMQKRNESLDVPLSHPDYATYIVDMPTLQFSGSKTDSVWTASASNAVKYYAEYIEGSKYTYWQKIRWELPEGYEDGWEDLADGYSVYNLSHCDENYGTNYSSQYPSSLARVLYTEMTKTYVDVEFDTSACGDAEDAGLPASVELQLVKDGSPLTTNGKVTAYSDDLSSTFDFGDHAADGTSLWEYDYYQTADGATKAPNYTMTATVGDGFVASVSGPVVTKPDYTLDNWLHTFTVTIAPGYQVNIGSTTNGTVTANKTKAAEGETVTLTVTPNAGYALEDISGVTETKVDDTTYTFTMPANDVTVTASFKKTLSDVTIKAVDADTNEAIGGAVIVLYDESDIEIGRWESVANATKTFEGLTIGKTYTLQVEEAPIGYGIPEKQKFTVTAEDMSLAIAFEPIEAIVTVVNKSGNTVQGAKITVKSAEGSEVGRTEDSILSFGKYLQAGKTYTVSVSVPEGYKDFADRILTVAEDGTVTIQNETPDSYGVYALQLTGKNYYITAEPAEGGRASAPYEAAYGDTVPVTVYPNTGRELNSLGLYPSTLGYEPIGNNQYTFTMPAENVYITPSFLWISYEIEVNGVADGKGKIEADKSTANYENEVKLTVTDVPAGYKLTFEVKDESGNTVDVSPASGGNGEYTFKMPASDVTVSATASDDAFTEVDKDKNLWTDGNGKYFQKEEGVFNEVHVHTSTTQDGKTVYTVYANALNAADDLNKLPSGGSYYFAMDIKAPGNSYTRITFNQPNITLDLCLNGNTSENFQYTTWSGGSGTINITDCSSNASGTIKANGSTVILLAGGSFTFNVSNITIDCLSRAFEHGASDSTFTATNTRLDGNIYICPMEAA